jgi:hypothetical protein
MTNSQSTPQPVSMSIIGLLGAVVLALLISSAVVWMGIRYLSPGEAGQRGFLAGTIASVAAGLGSIVPLVIGARFGMMGVVGGYFAGSFVRALVAGGICAVFILAWAYPPVPTLLTMAVHYLAVLTAESIVVGRVLWNVQNKQVNA